MNDDKDSKKERRPLSDVILDALNSIIMYGGSICVIAARGLVYGFIVWLLMLIADMAVLSLTVDDPKKVLADNDLLMKKANDIIWLIGLLRVVELYILKIFVFS